MLRPGELRPDAGVELEGDDVQADRPRRQALLQHLLEKLLCQPIPLSGDRKDQPSSGTVRLEAAEDKGEYVHTFSHIKQSNRIERVVLSVKSLEELQAACDAARSVGKGNSAKTAKVKESLSLPSLRWVKAEDIAQACLPTLTAKIFKTAMA